MLGPISAASHPDSQPLLASRLCSVLTDSGTVPPSLLAVALKRLQPRGSRPPALCRAVLALGAASREAPPVCC